METDWQHEFKSFARCGAYLLRTGKYADCTFVVGSAPHQKVYAGHKLYFRMASCVFHEMFCEKEPDNDELFFIPDLEPDVFVKIMQHVYANMLFIASFDKACALYTASKKYKLRHMEKECKQYLCETMSPKNACRAYELAKKFDDKRLQARSMKVIKNETKRALSDPSFLTMDISTVFAILDQDILDINSELDLFGPLMEYANKRCAVGDWVCLSRLNNNSYTEENAATQTRNVPLDKSSGDDTAALNGTHGCGDGDKLTKDNETCEKRHLVDEKCIREALKKLRFLTLTPKQFVDGPAFCKFLSTKEALTIFIKIASDISCECHMPEGFSESRVKRKFGEKCIPLPWDIYFPEELN